MSQKVLAARSGDAGGQAASSAGEMIDVQVDHVVLARAPVRAFGEALAAGLKRASAEVAIAYDGRCVTGRGLEGGASARGPEEGVGGEGAALSADMLARGMLVARAGVGFPGPVHLERFASPGRLGVTDEPRLSGVGGIGMLMLVVPTRSLAHALAQGSVAIRAPVSVQVVLAGRLRPFVCARDVALELLRRGLADTVRRVEETSGAPVVVEYTGPSVRTLSVGERSVLSSLAPQVGAAAALFVSDERTEVFLRDQRRSKAHRALAPDAGSPSVEVMNVDLGAVDPLLLDERGQVRSARDLAGQPVSQVLLGGDSGATLRDLFAAAALLKSKRVPPRLDFLVAPPSRQMLEVLSAAGSLTDLIAAGARLLEPDARIARGVLYPPPPSGVSLRTCDPEPQLAQDSAAGRPIVASAETLAFAVATGEVGDPRAFKRPVRITVPRALPTDDVLVSRRGERGATPPTVDASRFERAASPWRAAQTLDLVEGPGLVASSPKNGSSGMAVVCVTLDEVRDLATRAPDVAHAVRAVLASYIPSALVALLSAAGIAAIRVDASAAKLLKGHRTIALPAPGQWPERQATTVSVGAAKLPLTWLAMGAERAWATGAAKPAAAQPPRAAR